MLRSCYGVGSGSSTVGGDSVTNKTQPLTDSMKNMCNLLSNHEELIEIAKKPDMKPLKFNHVTVLYYLSRQKSNVITLNAHCDVEVTSSNIFKQGNSQSENTPTVVLSFCETKSINFHKRYVEGGRFGIDKKVCSLSMSDGEMFVLHPNDERVIKRTIRSRQKKKRDEAKSSQFKHSVTFNLDITSGVSGNDCDGSTYRVTISACFRDVQTSNWFNDISNTLVPNYINANLDDKDDDIDECNITKSESERAKKRAKKEMLISKVRQEMLSAKVRGRINSELLKFYNNFQK